jgi:hypothetical protein
MGAHCRVWGYPDAAELPARLPEPGATHSAEYVPTRLPPELHAEVN